MRRIAIACGYSEDRRSYCLRRYYVEALHACGLAAYLLPCAPCFELEGFDGLLLAGGGDLHPSFWQAEPTCRLGTVDRERDRFELELAGAAIERQMPILAICRGMQVLNVALGGSLLQDLPLAGGYLNHDQTAPPEQCWHWVRVVGESRLWQQVSFEVNSFHHQAVERLGSGLRMVAQAADGVIEAYESADGLLLGVQWHPEYLLHSAVSGARIWEHFAALTAGRA